MSIGSHCEHPILFLVLRPHIFFFYGFYKFKKKKKEEEEIIWWVTKKKTKKSFKGEKKNILLTQFFCPFLSKFIANKTNEKEKQFPVNSTVFPLLFPKSKQIISEPFKNNTKKKKEKRKKRVTWT